jgi:hypothetical protein
VYSSSGVPRARPGIGAGGTPPCARHHCRRGGTSAWPSSISTPGGGSPQRCGGARCPWPLVSSGFGFRSALFLLDLFYSRLGVWTGAGLVQIGSIASPLFLYRICPRIRLSIEYQGNLVQKNKSDGSS